MENHSESPAKQITLSYTDNGGDDMDISMKSDGFGKDLSLIVAHLQKAIEAIVLSQESNDDLLD